MVKKTIFLLFFLLLVVVGIVLASNLWLPYVMAFGIRQVTGFPTAIQRASLDLASSKFAVYGIKIQNPDGFPKGNFVSIPEIYAAFDLQNFLKHRRLHIREFRLNIEEVAIVKNENGQSNISRLTSVNRRRAEVSEEKKKMEKVRSSQELKFFVDTLILTIRRVRFQDRTNPLIGEKTIDLRIEGEIVHGLSSPADIVRLVVLRVIYRAALGNLGVPVDVLKGQLDASLAEGQVLVLQGTTFAEEIGTQAFGEGKRIITETSQKLPVSNAEVEKVVGGTTTRAKSLFGGATNLLKNTAQSLQEKAKSTTSSD